MSSPWYNRAILEGAVSALTAVGVLSTYYWVQTKYFSPLPNNKKVNNKVLSINVFKDADTLTLSDELKSIMSKSEIKVELDDKNNVVNIYHELNKEKVLELVRDNSKK